MSKTISAHIRKLLRDGSDDVVVIRLSDYGRAAVDTIRRDFETDEEAINRILTTLLPTAPDFDHFFGEPTDGRGPSGGKEE
jgi:hypothetical protein